MLDVFCFQIELLPGRCALKTARICCFFARQASVSVVSWQQLSRGLAKVDTVRQQSRACRVFGAAWKLPVVGSSAFKKLQTAHLDAMNLTWYQDWYFVCMSASPWGRVNLQEANTAKKSYNQARWGLHFEALTGEDPRHEGLRGSLPEPGQMGGARAQNFKVSIAKPSVHNFVPELCPKLWQMSVYFGGSLNSFSFFLYFFRLPVALSLSLPRSPSISLALAPSRPLPPWMRCAAGSQC